MEEVARSYAESRGLAFHKKVGSGAFKETFLVSLANEQLALKVLSANFAAERTAREIDAMMRCSHPNVCTLRKVEDFKYSDKAYTCLLEDFLAGGTLGEKLKAGPATRDEVFSLGRTLTQVLTHLESLDLVHRDFKPENIMFRSPGEFEPVVVDFGLVRNLSKDSITNTWLVRGPGTPLYAPPEQLNNRKELIDGRSDQFSIGVTLSHCLLGFHPYSDEREDPNETVERVASYRLPTSRFLEAVRTFRLPVLGRMVMPYPVQRIRRAEELERQWLAQ